MANKCLVTKLKSAVDNPNVPYFGEISFKVLSGKKRDIVISTNNDVIATISGGLFKTSWEDPSGTTNININNTNVHLYILPNYGVDAIVKLTNKYAITNFYIPYSNNSDLQHSVVMNANDLEFSPLFGAISFMMSYGITGNLNKILLNLKGITNLDIFQTSITGTTEDISNAILPSSLQRISAVTSGLTGNINHLAKYFNISLITGEGITGTIEEFAPLFLAACTAAGITEKDVLIEQTNVTYQGTVISGKFNHLIIENGSWSFHFAE